MPITPPVIDDRRFGQLVDETLARARVHTPEWTNFNQSDPGVTLVAAVGLHHGVTQLPHLMQPLQQPFHTILVMFRHVALIKPTDFRIVESRHHGKTDARVGSRIGPESADGFFQGFAMLGVVEVVDPPVPDHPHGHDEDDCFALVGGYDLPEHGLMS